MEETFVRMCKVNGVTQRMRDIWTVSVRDGKYVISANGQPICHGAVRLGQTCEAILRECCGGVFSRVS